MQGLIITGTDTGVGKTYVATRVLRALRLHGIRAGAYKPAVSGAVAGPDGPEWDDLRHLQTALDGEFPVERIGPQRFLAPLAPPVAARQEGRRVDPVLLRAGLDWWRNQAEFVIIEGAGGLLSPMTETESLADLAMEWQFPLLVIARLSLGTINHTLLTLEAAATRSLPVVGIVLNEPIAADPDDCSVITNPAELQSRCDVPLLAIVRHSPATDLRHGDPLLTMDWRGLVSDCTIRRV